MTASELAASPKALEAAQGFTIGKGKIIYHHIELCTNLVYYAKYKCTTEDKRSKRYVEPGQDVRVIE